MHASLKLHAGVNERRTPALNEAGISTSQCIRFVADPGGEGLVQKLGGWAKYFGSQIGSMVRALWAWNDIDDVSHLGIGAEESLSVLTNGALVDITPRTLEYSVPVKFETVKGSSLVKITDGGNFTYTTTAAAGDGTTATLTFSGSHIYPVGGSVTVAGVTPTGYNGNHVVTASTASTVSFLNATTGVQTIAGTVTNESFITSTDAVQIKTQIAVGGLIMFGLYQCIKDSTDTYFITALDALGEPAPALWDTISKTTTVASGDLTTATLTWSGAYTGFPIGSVITVAGVTPTGYNGTHIVTGGSSTTVEFASTATGAMSVAGTISNYGTVPLFATASATANVTVYLYSTGLSPGDSFPVLVETDVNGIQIFGQYTVQTVTADATSGVGNSFTIIGNSTASSVATTGASGTGATATLTYSGPYTFPVGSSITVAGVTPLGYNATATVTASSATSVSYANATTGSQTVSGTITLNAAFVPENAGYVDFLYFIGLSTTSIGSGFGVGPFGAGGFGVGVSPAPPTGTKVSTVDWWLDNWGSIELSSYLANEDEGGSPIFSYDPTASQPNATVIAQAPVRNQGFFVAMPQRQIVAWGTTFTGVQDHLLLRWCDVEDYTQWIGQPTNQAGEFRIARGSRIIRGMQAPQQGLIWTDLGLWSMQYIGQPYVYSFNEIGSGCGLIAPKAADTMNGVVYWMSQTQFFQLTGNGVEVIECDIWDVIFQQLDRDNINKIRAAANSRFNEMSWFAPTLSSNGEIGLCIKFNTVLRKWDYSIAPLTRTAWINQSVLGAPIGAGTDRFIYMHESMNGATLLNNDTLPLTSSFTTGYFVLSEGEMMTFLDQFWPDFKWGLFDGTQNANVQITFNVVNFLGDTPRTYGPFTVTQATRYFTPRFRGRLVSMTIASSDIDSFWRMGNNRYRIQADGKF